MRITYSLHQSELYRFYYAQLYFYSIYVRCYICNISFRNYVLSGTMLFSIRDLSVQGRPTTFKDLRQFEVELQSLVAHLLLFSLLQKIVSWRYNWHTKSAHIYLLQKTDEFRHMYTPVKVSPQSRPWARPSPPKVPSCPLLGGGDVRTLISTKWCLPS